MAELVRRGPTPAAVAGSNPVSRSTFSLRRLVIYFAGLAVVYVAAAVALQPSAVPGGLWAPGIMLAPTIGALLTRFLAPGVIVWGRPNLWIVAGLLPGVAGLAGYWVAAGAGLITVDNQLLVAALRARP